MSPCEADLPACAGMPSGAPRVGRIPAAIGSRPQKKRYRGRGGSYAPALSRLKGGSLRRFAGPVLGSRVLEEAQPVLELGQAELDCLQLFVRHEAELAGEPVARLLGQVAELLDTVPELARELLDELPEREGRAAIS